METFNPPDASQVSVIVVSFNTVEALRRSLASLPASCEVIVVDNASVDGSADMVAREFPTAILVRNKLNVGFGAANNQGFERSTRPLQLLLNSDAWLESSDAIDILASNFADVNVVAAGGKLHNPGGSLQDSSARQLTLWAVFCEQFFLERLVHSYWTSRNLAALDGPSETWQVMGACLMMRKVAIFDERFFLYCEDTELCHRLHKFGKILYDPRALFFHELGQSSSGMRWQSVALYNRGKELYFLIHYGKVSAAICWIFNRMGAGLRLLGHLILSVARRSSRGKVWLFLKVLLAPVAGPRMSTRTPE